MISIRTYLRAEKQTHDRLYELVQMLIAGIEHHSVPGAPPSARLHDSLQQLLMGLAGPAIPDDLLIRAERAMEALGQHNQNVADYLRSPVAELQAKVNMLTEAVTAISRTSPENIRRLQQIKDRLVETVDVREIGSLRASLAQCLDSVLVEAERQHLEGVRAAELLNRSRRRPDPDGSEEEWPLDPATGLPTRAMAEEAIAQSCQDAAAAFVVVMVINQAQTLSRSLGGPFGDLVLQRFSEVVREGLPAVDQLFRWTGPSLVALVRRRTAADVRGVIEPVLRQRVTVRSLNPDLVVPVSCRWTVLPLMASPRMLFHKMDGFAGIEKQEETLSA